MARLAPCRMKIPRDCVIAGRDGTRPSMKTIFIDCNDELDAVFARVLRPDDPAIVVHASNVAAGALPRLLDGYDICLDDHSFMPTDLVAQCASLKHIVFPGTGA